jgi:AmmeMemoRadiSam system protein A
MKNKFTLSEKEKSTLLEIVQNTLNNHVGNDKLEKIAEEKLTENLKLNVGAFVTIYNDGQLRGCIGQFMPNIPLYKIVQELAISASTYDNRFTPVSVDELDDISIEISVLTPLQKITSIDEIEIGRDGIYIIKGGRSGTLLPQVASDNNWTSLQLLEYCSEHKTGIGKNGWKKAELFIYQAIVF